MSLTYLHPQKAAKAYRAAWVMVTPGRIEENVCLETQGFRVTGITKAPAAPDVVDLGPGLVMPLLFNAHTHLELSALKGKTDPSKGFEVWVKELMGVREALGPAALSAAALKEIRRSREIGTGAVAEISTLGLTRELMAEAGLSGIWFQEVLGGKMDSCLVDLPGTAAGCQETGTEELQLSLSLAGHAPHTTSPEVLRQVKAVTQSRGLPFSIHVAESEAESRFLRGENSEWKRFLSSRGIDTADWPLGNKTPVAYLDALGLLGPGTIGVHLIDTALQDLDRIAQTGTLTCLCPRSNSALHGRLPDIPAMLNRGIAPALGTDSLASCDSLSLFDEMAFTRKHFPGIPPETVLRMAGVNGASALGLASFMGTLKPGQWAGCLYIDLAASGRDDILERLTTNEF